MRFSLCLWVSSVLALAPNIGRSDDLGKAPGAWSRATTIAAVSSKWMKEPTFQQLLTTRDPDELLRVFGLAEARMLVAIGLDLGVEKLFEARDQKNTPIPVPERNLDIRMQAFKTTERGQSSYRVVFTLRNARLGNVASPVTAPGPQAMAIGK